MRSENGQLLMIPQQALAQMQAQAQAQAQPQSSMGPRPATPTSAPPVQISAVQVSECPLPSFSAGTPRPAPPRLRSACAARRAQERWVRQHRARVGRHCPGGLGPSQGCGEHPPPWALTPLGFLPAPGLWREGRDA